MKFLNLALHILTVVLVHLEGDCHMAVALVKFVNRNLGQIN